MIRTAWPIRVIIPFVPGGSSDFVGRAIANNGAIAAEFVCDEVDRSTRVAQRGGVRLD